MVYVLLAQCISVFDNRNKDLNSSFIVPRRVGKHYLFLLSAQRKTNVLCNGLTGLILWRSVFSSIVVATLPQKIILSDKRNTFPKCCVYFAISIEYPLFLPVAFIYQSYDISSVYNFNETRNHYFVEKIVSQHFIRCVT